MNKATRIIAKSVGAVISQMMMTENGLKFINYIYERAPHSFTKLFVKYAEFPNRQFHWNIRLLNNKTVKVVVEKDDKLTKEFAVSYRWHSQGLKHVEALINEYYPNNVSWVDVGANMGLRSLYALSIGRPVVFIEPNAKLNKYNLSRCELNKFTNYRFVESGASDRQGTVEFLIDHSSYCSTIEQNVLDKSSVAEKLVINIDTLDNILSEEIENTKSVCVKIDVEGHELKVLKGANKLMQILSPTMIIEVNEKGRNLLDLLSTTSKYGYSVFEIGDFGQNKYLKKLNNNSEQSFQSIRFNDFLFIKDQGLINSLNKNILN